MGQVLTVKRQQATLPRGEGSGGGEPRGAPVLGRGGRAVRPEVDEQFSQACWFGPVRRAEVAALAEHLGPGMRDDLHEPFILVLKPRGAATAADGEHRLGDRGQVAAGEADLRQHVFEHVCSGVPRRRRSQWRERFAWPHYHLPEATLVCWQGADGGEAGPECGLGGVPVVVSDHGCFQAIP